MEKRLDELKKALVLLMGVQLFFSIVIYGNLVFLVGQEVLPLPQPIIDVCRLPLFLASLGAFLILYWAILLIILLKGFEETRQLSKKEGNAEPWMATIGPGAFFFPSLFLMWKNDASGKRVEGTERMLFCLPANSNSVSSLSVPLNQLKPRNVSAFSDASGKLRLIRTEDNLYLAIFAYPAPIAKMMLSTSQQMFLPPK